MSENLVDKIEGSRDSIQERLIQLNRDLRSEFEAIKDAAQGAMDAAVAEATAAAQVVAPEPAASTSEGGANLTELLTAADDIHQSVSQVDLLKSLVAGASRFLPRVLLLIKKGDNLHGWAGAGFSAAFLEGRMKKIKWSLLEYSELAQVVEGSATLATNFSNLGQLMPEIESFDGFVPFKSIFFPLIVKNKVAAILYADSGESPVLSGTESVDLLCHLTGLELSLVAAKSKVIPTKPRMSDGPVALKLPEPVSDLEPELDLEPEPLPELPSEDLDDHIDDFEEPAPDFSEASSFEESASTDFASFEPIPEPEPAPAPEPPPAPVVEESDSVKKARRAARVLVSDLKLYNEQLVTIAVQNGQLYERLKDDIDRSYQHYQERIRDLDAPKDTNFFKEELVRQLGDGDAQKLGPLPF